jgi:hypothetical protein
MENKLISMTDFVLEHPATTDYEWQLQNHLKYANFLKQPLTIRMFVPCDDDENVLEEIKGFDPDIHSQYYASQIYQNHLYNKAKEKVLFDGFYISKYYITNGDLQIDDEWIQGKTIENLIPYNLTLKNKMLKF